MRGTLVTILLAVASVVVSCVQPSLRRRPDTTAAAPATSLTLKPAPTGARDLSPKRTAALRENDSLDADPVYPRSVEDRAGFWLGRAHEFKPIDDDFPQIVQSNDYDTIASIEALYSALQALSHDPKKWPSLDPAEPLAFRIDDDAIVVSGGDRSVSIKVDDRQASFAGRTFRKPSTVTLFRALHAVSQALAAEFPPVGVLGTQFATRAYQRSTRLHFSFGPLIIELEGAHNGLSSPERLYILDLARTRESLLWSSVTKNGGAPQSQ